MKRFGLEFVTIVLLACFVPTMAQTAKTAKPDKPVRVIVKKADGTSVAGEMTDASRRGVSVRKTAKDEPVLVPWDEIKSVSNGLTREKAIEQWKAKHANDFCPTCAGEGETVHAACKGSGVDPAQATPCEACKGEGSTGPCETKGCEAGKIECTGPCLRLTKGVWKKGEDGKIWQSFRVKGGGVFRVSDAHLGEVHRVVNGEMMHEGPCPVCKGTTKIDDPACKGTDKKPCDTCHGGGMVGPADAACHGGKVECETCKGSGLRSA